jgi:hypothetical protein
MKRYLKVSILAVIVAGIIFLEMIRIPIKVSAEPVITTPTPTATLTPTATPTVTPTPMPQYSMGKYSDNEYAQYIWSKWAPHGNHAQAVALCTNIAEGHLDDNAYNVNTDGSTDAGCWQWNSIHNLPDSITRNCKEATDYTYKVWLKRMNLGILDGFQGMWYGYGSNNYQLCMNSL